MGIETILDAVGDLAKIGTAAALATQEKKAELRALCEDAMRRYREAFDSLPAAMAANDAAADAALLKRFPAGPPAVPAPVQPPVMTPPVAMPPAPPVAAAPSMPPPGPLPSGTE